jgi:hypothetical protein
MTETIRDARSSMPQIAKLGTAGAERSLGGVLLRQDLNQRGSAPRWENRRGAIGPANSSGWRLIPEPRRDPRGNTSWWACARAPPLGMEDGWCLGEEGRTMDYGSGHGAASPGGHSLGCARSRPSVEGLLASRSEHRGSVFVEKRRLYLHLSTRQARRACADPHSR